MTTSHQTPRPVWAQALREARTGLGWDVHRLAVEMVRAAGPDATATTESLTRRIREWEAGRSAIRERYRLLLARVLQVDDEVFDEQPTRSGDTARVRAITSNVIALDEMTGSADLLPMAVRTARSAHQTSLVSMSSEMASAAAEALQVAGWLAFDADEQLLARRLTSASVLTARAGGDRDGELFALTQLAMQDAHEHRPDQARQVCEHILDEQVTPRVLGLFELRLARAEGQEGTPGRAVETLHRARSRLRGEAQDRDPPWVWWITEAELAWQEAMIHADNGAWGQTVELFETALQGRPATYHRGALNDASHLAHALVRVGSWQGAQNVLAGAVVPMLGHIRSGRTHALLVQVQHFAEQAGAPASVRELADHAASVR
ncbi:DNA-binding protein [Nocardiopsis nanhaiensis]